MPKVEEIHRKKGISTRAIPLKTLASLLNEASYEEEEDLVDMWARLLAHATDSSNDIDYHNVFVKMLADLSSQEAKVLYSFWRKKMLGIEPQLAPLNAKVVSKEIFGNGNQDYRPSESELTKSEIICNNLVRVGILEVRILTGSLKRQIRSYRITELGRSFLRECCSD